MPDTNPPVICELIAVLVLCLLLILGSALSQ